MTTYTHAVVGLGLGYAFAARRAPLGYLLAAPLPPVLPNLDIFPQNLKKIREGSARTGAC